MIWSPQARAPAPRKPQRSPLRFRWTRPSSCLGWPARRIGRWISRLWLLNTRTVSCIQQNVTIVVQQWTRVNSDISKLCAHRWTRLFASVPRTSLCSRFAQRWTRPAPRPTCAQWWRVEFSVSAARRSLVRCRWTTRPPLGQSVSPSLNKTTIRDPTFIIWRLQRRRG